MDEEEVVRKEDGYQIERSFKFVIHDMPSSLAGRLIRFTQSHSGNKVYVAIQQLLDNYELKERIDSLDSRISKLENMVEAIGSEPSKEEAKPATFGGGENE